MRKRIVLTPRQREVIRHLSAGMTIEEVAERMNLQPNTVYQHITRAKLTNRCATQYEFLLRTGEEQPYTEE